MAEAVAAVSLVAAIVQFVDLSSKIIGRLDGFQSDLDKIPQTLQDIKDQLPLLLNTLQRTKTQAEAGHIDYDTQKADLSVVEGCRSQVHLLDDVLVKTLPAKGDSRWRKGLKAFSSVGHEKAVERITERLRGYVQTLTYHQATGTSTLQPTKFMPMFAVPFERDPKSVGRSDIMDQLDQRLAVQSRVALSGIGGVGENDRWLLVLDNADDAEAFFGVSSTAALRASRIATPIAGYISRGPNGSVITTRDRRVGEKLANREQPISVSPFTTQEAEQLLRSKVSEVDACNKTDWEELVQALGHLPLAISQAAAFITENNITVADYLQVLQASDADVKDLLSEELEDPRRDMHTQNAVFRTWKLSFNQITRQKPRAADTLSLMAVLDRQGIPKSVLRKSDDRMINFTTAIGTLQAFSLITAEKGGMSFEIHRLVQICLQRWLELKGKLSEWRQEATKVLSEIFPPGMYENWRTCESLYPHVQVVAGYTIEPQTYQLCQATLLANAAIFDHTHGRYQVAFDNLIRTLAIHERIFGPEHLTTMTSVGDLALVLRYQGTRAWRKVRASRSRFLSGVTQRATRM
ncbi:hypothetical protein H2201_008839 [Coniosporium apollinis]|uniref:NACHT-NTPase and P-loop NTPases N-terminal domain-containing protein n=1 Tax=Coniosporium apollinis TaxID=61459 RepID=A0ABQ9NID8_9PEZI|nr:hypothetical protein H2201_008839 [Coniosporium apollinis]